MRNNRRAAGFTLVEVIFAVAVIAVIMTGVALIMNKAIRVKRTSEALMNIKKIEEALEITYRGVIAYIEKNCAGFGHTGCWGALLTPPPINSTTLRVWIPTQSIYNAWVSAGCTLSGSSPDYAVTCPSGYGTDFTFSGLENIQNPGNLYINGYNKTPYTITISVTIPGGTTTVQDTWSSGYLDAEYYEKSNQKVLTLLRAIKAYHFNRLLYETNTNICNASTGGLASTDDTTVPWVWQLMGTAPQQKCLGIEVSPCGCLAFNDAAIWPNTSAFLQIDTDGELDRLINNLGIDQIYRTDGYGNRLTIRLLADRNGNVVASAPSRPKINYSTCLPGGSGAGCSNGVFSQMPPYTGVAGVLSGGAWLYSQKIVYAN